DTALWRTKRRGLLRNAAIVLGNRGDPSDLPALRQALNDAEPLIREAAAWAIGQIDCNSTQVHGLGVEKGYVAAAAAHDGDERRDVGGSVGLPAQRLFHRAQFPLMILAGRTAELAGEPLHPLAYLLVELFVADHGRSTFQIDIAQVGDKHVARLVRDE